VSQLLEFYRGTGLDTEGRTLTQIWGFSDEEMEARHDFIQWLFPLREPSRFNPNAPLLSTEDVSAFHAEPALRAHLLHSLDRFLDFLGLVRRDDLFGAGPRFSEKRALWTVSNHNWLRISRVLHCLRIAGLEDHARHLFACLAELDRSGQARIAHDTLGYWRHASGAIET
jgi:hypothetical protein